jgi:hypothetical protein
MPEKTAGNEEKKARLTNLPISEGRHGPFDSPAGAHPQLVLWGSMAEHPVSARVEESLADSSSNATSPRGTMGRSELVAVTTLVGLIGGQPVVTREFRVFQSRFPAGFSNIFGRQGPRESEIDEGDFVFRPQHYPAWFATAGN